MGFVGTRLQVCGCASNIHTYRALWVWATYSATTSSERRENWTTFVSGCDSTNIINLLFLGNASQLLCSDLVPSRTANTTKRHNLPWNWNQTKCKHVLNTSNGFWEKRRRCIPEYLLTSAVKLPVSESAMRQDLWYERHWHMNMNEKMWWEHWKSLLYFCLRWISYIGAWFMMSQTIILADTDSDVSKRIERLIRISEFWAKIHTLIK